MINSLSLIGMPACGKSTLGRHIARRTGLRFVDGDRLIEQREGQTLAQMLAQRGYLGLREAEERALLAEDFSGVVLATGGSAVYSQPVMKKLHRLGPVVFIDVIESELAKRLGNFAERGVACAPGTDLSALYAERQPLYEREADVRVAALDRGEQQLAEEILLAAAEWQQRQSDTKE